MFKTPKSFRGKELLVQFGTFCSTIILYIFFSKLCFCVTLYNVHATNTCTAEVPFLLPTIFSYTCNAETTELCQLRDISALIMSGNFLLDAKRCRKTTTDKQEIKHKKFRWIWYLPVGNVCFVFYCLLFQLGATQTKNKDSKKYFAIIHSLNGTVSRDEYFFEAPKNQTSTFWMRTDGFLSFWLSFYEENPI